MGLRECIECVKKNYIYTGIQPKPCLYSLKDLKHAMGEVDEALTKADCVVSYPIQDEGIFGWGLSTRADVLIIAAVLFGVVIILSWLSSKNYVDGTRIIQQLKSMVITLVASGLFPTLLALQAVPHGRIRTYCADVATRFAQYLQSNSTELGTNAGNGAAANVIAGAGPGAGDVSAGAGDGTGTQEHRIQMDDLPTPTPLHPFQSQVVQSPDPPSCSSGAVVKPSAIAAGKEEQKNLETLIDLEYEMSGSGYSGLDYV